MIPGSCTNPRPDHEASNSISRMELRDSGSRLSKGTYNRLLVRAALFHRGPASRVELKQLTGLPLSALTEICRDLLCAGLIRETSTVRPSGSGRGRRRTLLEINAAGLGVACLVYDRERVEAVVADLSGAVRWRRRWNGPFAGSRAQLSRRLRSALKAALRAAEDTPVRLLAVGAGDPGLVDRADGLEALGEVAFGAGRAVRSALYVTLVDGVGGGVVENGRLVAGRDGAAGEIGHTNVSPGGPMCGCGLRGCVEAFVAPRRLLERLRSATAGGASTGDSAPAEGDGAAFTAMIRAARQGDSQSRQILAEVARTLARAIGSAVNLLNPQRVILGGYLVEAGDVMLEPLRAALPKYTVREMFRGLEVRLAELGDAACFLGMVAHLREAIFAYPATAERMNA